MTHKSTAVKIILLIASLFASFFIMEWAVRYFIPQQVVSPYVQADENLGNITKPNKNLYGYLETFKRRKYGVKTNEFGFRVKDKNRLIYAPSAKKFSYWEIR